MLKMCSNPLRQNLNPSTWRRLRFLLNTWSFGFDIHSSMVSQWNLQSSLSTEAQKGMCFLFFSIAGKFLCNLYDKVCTTSVDGIKVLTLSLPNRSSFKWETKHVLSLFSHCSRSHVFTLRFFRQTWLSKIWLNLLRNVGVSRGEWMCWAILHIRMGGIETSLEFLPQWQRLEFWSQCLFYEIA